MADHRPDVYFSEARGKWIFRASSLSRCIQSLVAAGLGHERMPPPEFMQKAWAEGSHGEAEVLRLFRDGSNGWHPKSPMLSTEPTATGLRFKHLDPLDAKSYHQDGTNYPFVTLENLQSDQVDDEPQFVLEMPVGDKALIRGHLDEIVQCVQGPIGTGASWLGKRFPVEAKLFGVDYFKKMLNKGLLDPGFTNYAWQLSLYMHGTGLPGFFVVGEKKRWTDEQVEGWVDAWGELPPEHARYDLDSVHVTLFDTPPIPLAPIKVKVLKVLGLIERGEMPPCDQVQYPCDYYHLCTDKKEVVVPGAEKPPAVVVLGDDREALKKLAINYTAAQAAEKAAKDAVKVAKTKVEEELAKLGLDKDKPGLWDLGDRVVEWQVQERAAEKEPRKGYTVRMMKVKMKEADE